MSQFNYCAILVNSPKGRVGAGSDRPALAWHLCTTTVHALLQGAGAVARGEQWAYNIRKYT